MIKNIKLPVVVSTVKVMFNFVLLFEIDKMFIDLLSESCEEGLGGGFLHWVTKMSQYFEDKFFQISLNF